jgi:hypothetical protein
MKKKLTGLLLALAMVFSLLPSSALAASTETQTGFTDVASTEWYAGSVAYVSENGLMNGTSDTTFDPQVPLTRAMFVTILGRMYGFDTEACMIAATNFTDVDTSQWYSPYVSWAYSNGIVTGYSDTIFGTNDPVTREQMATMISRYVAFLKVYLPKSETATEYFTDVASISRYASDGVELMRTTGIITGYEDGSFRPQDSTTRAEAATIFMRLNQAIASAEAQEPEETQIPSEEPTPSEEPAPSEPPVESPIPSEEPAPSEPPVETPIPSESPDKNQDTTSAAIVADGTCGDNLTWTLDSNGTLTISGTGEMWDFEKGKTTDPFETYYGTEPWQDLAITKVVIEDGVTSIGLNAFEGCTNLVSVTIPNSVTSIGEAAFANCDSLPAIVIPDGVTSLAYNTFYNCASLTSVTIPSSVTRIGHSVFSCCSSLTTVTIPDSVTSMGDSIFVKCTSLTSIFIPNSVTSMGDGVFSGCTSLTSVTLSNQLTRIGSLTFYHCTSLTSITIPDSVTSIGDVAFTDCTGLTDLYYGGNESQWAAVEIGEENEVLTDATIHCAQ